MDNNNELLILMVVEFLNHRNFTKPLRKKYNVKLVHSIEALENYNFDVYPDLIIIDQNLVKNHQHESRIRFICNNQYIPVIMLLDFQKESLNAIKLGVTDFFYKPIIPELLLHRIDIHMKEIQKLKMSTTINLCIHDQLKIQENMLYKMQSWIIQFLVEIIEFSDYDTTYHKLKTQLLLECFIRYMMENPNPYRSEVSSWKIDKHLLCFQLHDIGKIGIPTEILMKTDSLTKEEYDIVKSHVTVGAGIIDRVIKEIGENPYLTISKKYILGHHEHWDGTGYPNKLSGLDIPLEGRLMIIIDNYDALISSRPYREAYSIERANEIIDNGSGTLFDPNLVKMFNEVIKIFYK